ncbi:sensor histidine kinase [Microvirga subterranea]|uniref:histidine kinase n=1 Tax=Microvirga subterranea TaxID=186651 RepID=A0A370HCR9_9HYPH|nr:ATP-binding protein [Microvirga subterranea]RDI54865.1 histidine kinase/DNA gyrase B/HSP90-like ATPase [Microvirga subterranea]
MRRSPLFVILAALVCGALTSAGAVWMALQPPWLGLRLAPGQTSDTVLVLAVHPTGPSSHLREPRFLKALDGFPLKASDLTEDPDQLSPYSSVEAFMDRQALLRSALEKPSLRIGFENAAGYQTESTISPRPRPLSDLPAGFWIQIACGLGGLLISTWIWALRQGDAGARLFGLSGIGLFLSATMAAVYSSREIALGGMLFQALSFTNHLGGLICSGGLALLFLVYPRRLVGPRTLQLIACVGLAWFLLDAFHWLPSPTYGIHGLVATFFILIFVAIAAQWIATARDPASRAIIRWLGTCVAIGTCTFIAFVSGPLLLGLEPVLSQAAAFIFLVLIYAGIAVGVSRYRLFELGEWAFRLAFYFAAALMLFAIDAALIFVLRLDYGLSLGLSFLVVGFGYLPLRDFLWRRLTATPNVSNEELFQRIVEVVLSPSPEVRSQRWRDLMERLFDPLEAEVLTEPVPAPVIGHDGLEMILPTTSVSPALALRYPWGGRGLFNPNHVAVAAQATALVQQADNSRQAFERGAMEERRRIARDLHDDVGARLLTSLHKPDLPETRETIRSAMADLRVVIGGLTGKTRPLGEVLADLRHETIERVEAAGLRISWPAAEDFNPTLLAYGTYNNLVSTMREIVSNALKHAQASMITVRVTAKGERVQIEVGDDGVGLPQAASSRLSSGLGLSSTAQRMADIGGSLTVAADGPGTTISLEFPISPVTAPTEDALTAASDASRP